MTGEVFHKLANKHYDELLRLKLQMKIISDINLIEKKNLIKLLSLYLPRHKKPVIEFMYE